MRRAHSSKPIVYDLSNGKTIYMKDEPRDYDEEPRKLTEAEEKLNQRHMMIFGKDQSIDQIVNALNKEREAQGKVK